MKQFIALFFVLILLSSSVYSAGLFTFLNKNRFTFYPLDVNHTDLNVNNVWALNYYGDGSGLTGIAAGGIDTNAETACAAGDVLFGDGTCGVPAAVADVNGEDISPQSVDIDANLGVRGDANFNALGTPFISYQNRGADEIQFFTGRTGGSYSGLSVIPEHDDETWLTLYNKDLSGYAGFYFDASDNSAWWTADSGNFFIVPGGGDSNLYIQGFVMPDLGNPSEFDIGARSLPFRKLYVDYIEVLKDINVSGDLNVGGDLNVLGDVNILGGISAGLFTGDGSGLTGVTASADINGEDVRLNNVEIDANLGVQGDANFHSAVGVSSGTWLYGDLFATDGTTKLFWDNDMGAFMAGFNPSATGWYSAAFGQGTEALGDYSTAFGLDTTARAMYSFVVGQDSTTNGAYSFAANYDNIAEGAASTAFGYKTNAIGVGSFAGGYSFGTENIYALGDGSMAFGYSDANLVAGGKGSIALGYNAFAMSDYLITLSRDVNIVNDLNVGGDLNVLGNLGVAQLTFLQNYLTLHADPTAPLHAATKEYVDIAVSGIDFEFFLTGSGSDIATYFDLVDMDTGEAESTNTSVALNAGLDQEIFNYATIAGQPEFKTLLSSVYDGHFHLQKSGGASKVVTAYWSLYERDVGGTESLILTSEESSIITTVSSVVDLHAVLANDTRIDANRLVVRIFANVVGGGGTVQVLLEQEGITDSHVSLKPPNTALKELFLLRSGNNWMVGDLNVGGNDLNNVRDGVFSGDLNVAGTLTVRDVNILGDLNVANFQVSGVSFTEGGIIASGDSNFSNLGANDVYLTNLTATGTITSGDITIFDATPILVFKDSDSLGAASVGFIEWKDSGGGRAGFFGNSSSGNDDLLWKNEVGGHITIQTTGAGELKVYADINAQDNNITTTGTLKVNDLNVEGSATIDNNIFVGGIGIQKFSPSSYFHSYVNNATTGKENMLILEQDGGAGDIGLVFSLTGLKDWGMGIDNSQDDSFNIATPFPTVYGAGDDVLTSSVLRLTRTGNLLINVGGYANGGKLLQFSKTSTPAAQIFDIFEAALSVGGGSGLAGHGLGYLFRIENGAGALHDAGRFLYQWTDPTATSEDSSFTIEVMSDGSMYSLLTAVGETKDVNIFGGLGITERTVFDGNVFFDNPIDSPYFDIKHPTEAWLTLHNISSFDNAMALVEDDPTSRILYGDGGAFTIGYQSTENITEHTIAGATNVIEIDLGANPDVTLAGSGAWKGNHKSSSGTSGITGLYIVECPGRADRPDWGPDLHCYLDFEDGLLIDTNAES